MKKSQISLAMLQAFARQGRRARTRDIAITYRMTAGFPGDVNRTHPFSVLPALMDTTNPVLLYGNPVIINTTANSIRQVLAGDTGVTKIAGVLVRPYPVSQVTGGMNSAIGAATPPPGPAVVDYLNEGFIMATCNNFAVNPCTKGGAVFIWYAASSGNHVQGGFEAAATGGSTIAITNAMWNGPMDTTTGVAELQVMAPGA